MGDIELDMAEGYTDPDVRAANAEVMHGVPAPQWETETCGSCGNNGKVFPCLDPSQLPESPACSSWRTPDEIDKMSADLAAAFPQTQDEAAALIRDAMPDISKTAKHYAILGASLANQLRDMHVHICGRCTHKASQHLGVDYVGDRLYPCGGTEAAVFVTASTSGCDEWRTE